MVVQVSPCLVNSTTEMYCSEDFFRVATLNFAVQLRNLILIILFCLSLVSQISAIPDSSVYSCVNGSHILRGPLECCKISFLVVDVVYAQESIGSLIKLFCGYRS